MHLLSGPKDCLAISNVETGMIEGTQVVILQGFLEVPTQLTAGAS
jgi:hypothetical protein